MGQIKYVTEKRKQNLLQMKDEKYYEIVSFKQHISESIFYQR
jgi:hypothetical protein